MNVSACWIHEDLVVKTVCEFATLALPDSVLAQWPEDGPAYPMPYEVSDAVPDSPTGRAYRVDVFLEMADPRQPDAHMETAVMLMGSLASISRLLPRPTLTPVVFTSVSTPSTTMSGYCLVSGG